MRNVNGSVIMLKNNLFPLLIGHKVEGDRPVYGHLTFNPLHHSGTLGQSSCEGCSWSCHVRPLDIALILKLLSPITMFIVNIETVRVEFLFTAFNSAFQLFLL